MHRWKERRTSRKNATCRILGSLNEPVVGAHENVRHDRHDRNKPPAYAVDFVHDCNDKPRVVEPEVVPDVVELARLDCVPRVLVVFHARLNTDAVLFEAFGRTKRGENVKVSRGLLCVHFGAVAINVLAVHPNRVQPCAGYKREAYDGDCLC